jgi:hypothetical protein
MYRDGGNGPGYFSGLEITLAHSLFRAQLSGESEDVVVEHRGIAITKSKSDICRNASEAGTPLWYDVICGNMHSAILLDTR